ncbi:hypothetical protein BDV93DRAFT_545280 [Ceratobasidium sp. AG-I]|nr:hypothetical protein BDV93DRAFT_545280 [Ceratobasidium sp. AG-I]
MSTFTRIAGAALLVLSLSYLVSALPAPAINVQIPAIIGTDAVSCVLAKFIAEIEVKIHALVGCGSIVQLTVAIQALILVFQGCCDELLKIGAGVAITVDAQANIVVCIAAMITLLAKVCAAVSIKFGILVVLGLFAQLDIVVKLLLINLNICIDGILVLIAKAIASVTVGVLAQVQLKLCLGVLGL